MKTQLSAFLLAVVSAALTPAVRATPTGNPLPGPTGLATIPTTETVAPGALEATLLFERADINGFDGHATLFPVVNATYGFGRAEVGAAYVREDSEFEGESFENDYFALHGKARLYDKENVQFALGAHYYDFGSEEGDLGSVLSFYATASTGFGRTSSADDTSQRGRLHGGVLFQSVDGEGEEGDEDVLRPFVGVEYNLSPAFRLSADYLAEDSEVADAYSVALRYQKPASPFAVQIGFGGFESDTRYFASLTYRFGGRAR